MLDTSSGEPKYVYNSTRKQVVMIKAQKKLQQIIKVIVYCVRLLQNQIEETSISKDEKQMMYETQESSNKRGFSLNNCQSLSQGFNSQRQQQDTVTGTSEYQKRPYYYSNTNLAPQKSPYKNVQSKLTGMRQKNYASEKRNEQVTSTFNRDSERLNKRNYIQNSIKIMQQENKQMAENAATHINTSNFERIGKQLHKTRLGFGIRNEREELGTLMRLTTDSPRHAYQSKQQNQTQVKIEPDLNDDRLKEFEKEQTEFHGQTAKQFIQTRQSEKWIQKRKPKHANYQAGGQRKHIEFAKNLFISWDDDGSGELDAGEIIQPLIKLGLSQDSKFAVKILQALDSKGNNTSPEDLKITLKDFIKIFKSDKVSEHLVSVINSEVLQQKTLQQQDIQNPPGQNIKHPDFFSPRISSTQSTKKRVTLSMLTPLKKKLVEIPVDQQVDQVSIHQRMLDKTDGKQKYRTQIFKGKETQPYENFNSIDEEEDSPIKQETIGRNQGSAKRGNDTHTSSISASQKKRNITLQEQIEILKSWWIQMDPHGVMAYEISTNIICNFMVMKRLVPDKEQAHKTIMQHLGLSQKKEKLTYDEFKKIFCKGMFKDNLISISKQFDQMNKANEELPLSMKLSHYQRFQFFSGLDPQSENFAQGRQILNSINDANKDDSSKNNVTYKQFIDDPFGQKTKHKEEEAKKKKQVDPFVERIKLIQDIEHAHHERRPANSKDLKKKQNKVTLLEAKQRYTEDPNIHILDPEIKDDDEDDYDHLVGRGRLTKELVKIPAVYLEKTQEERLKDANDLLTRFQKLLSLEPKINSKI